MKPTRYNEEQIVDKLKLAENDRRVSKRVHKHGITEKTFYRWRRNYGGMEVSDARRLNELEEENRKLKRIVAEQALDIVALKYVVQKNVEGADQESGGSACPASSWPE